TVIEDGEPTGFEENTHKESEPLMTHSGRNLKTMPLEGPYESVEEYKRDIKEFYEDRFAKPFRTESPEETATRQSAESADVSPQADK
ncbi:MAG: hypothetical protein ACI4QT_07235, partial [Kiritimatiellia bacterium]